MSAQDVVDRLEFCRPAGDGKWIARCPAHDDSAPSLSVKDAGNGKTLIHCFAGCGAVEVIEALGLDIGSLFPPTDKNYPAERKFHERSIDELVIEIAKADRAAGRVLSPQDREREAEAFARLILKDPSPEIERGTFRKNALAVAREISRR